MTGFSHQNTMIQQAQIELTDRYLGEHNIETATDELPKVK